MKSLALERFPRERRTLLVFLEELDRRLAAPEGEGDDDGFEALLSRFEEYLEALLVGEAHGLART